MQVPGLRTAAQCTPPGRQGHSELCRAHHVQSLYRKAGLLKSVLHRSEADGSCWQAARIGPGPSCWQPWCMFWCALSCYSIHNFEGKW